MAIVGSNLKCNQFLSYYNCCLVYGVKWNLYSAATIQHIPTRDSQTQTIQLNTGSLLLFLFGPMCVKLSIVPHPLARCSGLKYCPAPYSMTSTNLGNNCPPGHYGGISCHHSNSSLALLHFWGHHSTGKTISPESMFWKRFLLQIVISQT